MAKKTVINRACKMYANTSDDSDILIEAFNNTDKTYDEKDIVDNVKYEVKEEIKDKANKEPLDIERSNKKNQDKEKIKSQESNKVIDVEPKDTAKDQDKNEQQQTILEGPGF